MESIEIKEILHRLKNTVCGVRMVLDSHKEGITADNAVERIEQAKNRLDVISSIYDMLYDNNRFINKPDLSEYFNKTILLNLKSLNKDYLTKNIFIKDFKINLNLETTIMVGLIFNELFCNSLKYSLKTNFDVIKINVIPVNENEYKLIYSDNGKPFIKEDYKEGLGSRIIKNLLKDINGNMEIHNGSGWNIEINFVEKKYNK